MVDLSGVNAPKKTDKVRREEESNRWQKMQKEIEKQRFEESLFTDKSNKENLSNARQQKTTRDSEMYRFTQNREFNKLQRQMKGKNIKNINEQQHQQQLETKAKINNSTQKNLQKNNRLTDKLSQEVNKKNQTNTKLSTQEKLIKDKQEQQVKENKNYSRDLAASKNANTKLQSNKQQRLQQDNQNYIANRNSINSQKQVKSTQDKKNNLLKSKENIINQQKTSNTLNKQSEIKNYSNTLNKKNSNTVISENKIKSDIDTHQLQQNYKLQKEQQNIDNKLGNVIRESQNKNLKDISSTQQNIQKNINLHAKEKNSTDIQMRNKLSVINTSLKNKYNTEINKNKLNVSNDRISKQNIDYNTNRQRQEDISNQQNVNDINKNYLLNRQADKEQIARQENIYKLSGDQKKQEKNEKISVEKIYQENQVLPLPKHIDPSSTITQALQNPAQRVEIINHIVELIKTYRPFIIKEGAFNIIMPGTFWEGTKIIVDIYKKDLEVKISASEKIVNILEQNKTPLVEALKMADPGLNIKVDIKPVV